jgi:PilZ domain
MSASTGTDWTRILSDPDLVRQIGKLLQTYREAPPEKREQALVEAMREVKASAARAGAGSAKAQSIATPQPVPTPVSETPPFEPNLFSPNWGSDRRRHPRIKCFVAVEIRVDDATTPLWGNLSNTSVGGCLVETATPVPPGAKVEVGLWVANGKIWVKGFALNGIVQRSGRTAGVRVRFDALSPVERDSLRQFLKFVQDSTRASQSESTYLQLLK